jgi:subtilisin family serine protease
VTSGITETLSDPLGTLGRTTGAVGQRNDRAAASRRPAAVRRSGVPPAGEHRFVPGEVVISLPSSLPRPAVEALASRHGLARLESQSIGLTGTTFHRWRIADQRSVSDVIRALEADRAVRAAQPNYRFTLQQGQPATAQVDALQYVLAKLRLPEAHRFATGDNVLVAVIDSGIDTSHPEIVGMVAGRFNATNSREEPHSHGTAMAGAIIANANLRGVAPAARILAIRAFDGSSAGIEGTTMTIVRSIDWAVTRGARVLNMSFAGPNDPQIASALAAAWQKGVVLVAAAGNAGPRSQPLYPAADPNVIAVTATDADDKLLRAANRGRHIALAAPGVDILAPAPHARYQTTSGTSIAAAHVSGIAALLLERKPGLTPDAVRKVLLSSATDLGSKGRDDQFGAGLANAYRAISSLQGRPAPAPANVSAAR